MKSHLQRQVFFPWAFGIGCVVVEVCVLFLVQPEDRLSTNLSVLAALGGFMAFLYTQHTEQTNIFRELFKEFNARFDVLNGPVNEIFDRSEGVALKAEDHKILCDYFNLCAEEFMYYDSGFIDPRVWEAWSNGMKYFAKDPEIREFWNKELAQNSYYGFSLSNI